MSLPVLSCYIIAAMLLGWSIRHSVGEPPHGVDPVFWARAVRFLRRRRHRP